MIKKILMLFRTSLKQTLRMPVKLTTYFLVAALAVASFCVGLNLYENSEANLAAADACFTTIAVPEAFAEMTRGGTLMQEFTEEDYAPFLLSEAQVINMGLPAGTKVYGSFPLELQPAGYTVAHPTEAELGLARMHASGAVEQVNLCGRFGAYVQGGVSYGADADLAAPCANDVIVFSFIGAEPVVVPNYPSLCREAVAESPENAGNAGVYEKAKTEIRLKVHRNANPLLEYGDSITLVNRVDTDAFIMAELYGGQVDFPLGAGANDGSFRLEPGKQYIMMLRDVNSAISTNQTGKATHATVALTDYYATHHYSYNAETGKQAPVNGTVGEKPIRIVEEYTERFFETERGLFFKKAIEAIEISAKSLTVIATSDLSSMRPFHSGKVYLPQGRAFTEDEYTNSEKVCIVSAALAEYNGWKIGDILSLSFYRCDPIRYCDEPEAPTAEWKYSTYNAPDADGFFDEGDYTIVGMFDGRVEKLQRKQYNSTNDKLHMVNVIIPESSVQNAPAPSIYKYTSSIRLKNSEAQAFMAEMAVSGLMEEQPGGYELGLTVYDQGYSHVAPGLNQLARVSRLTLLLSAGAAGAAVLALALLHVLRMRREIAAMRSLGTKKGQIVVLSLAGILLVCLLGACAGAYAGHMVSAEVAGRVLAGAEEAAVDTTFTAMMGEETAKEFTFTLESDPKLAVAAGGAAVVAFTLLALLLLAAELRRPPMCLLAEKE